MRRNLSPKFYINENGTGTVLVAKVHIVPIDPKIIDTIQYKADQG